MTAQVLQGWAWWRLWLWLVIRHPRAYKTLYHTARYSIAHRKCDTSDFHHMLGCDISPRSELNG